MRGLLKSILSLSFLVLVSCKEDLVHLNSELSANQVLFALRDQGIDAAKVSIGKEWVIKINHSDLTSALRVMQERRLFVDEEVEKESSGDVFRSREDIRMGRDRDLARSLSSSIQLMASVKEARVHIYNAPHDVLSLNQVDNRSASVLVVREEGSPDEDLIKELVSKGAGMPKDKVSVLFVEGKKGGVVTEKVDLELVESAPEFNAGGGVGLREGVKKLNSSFRKDYLRALLGIVLFLLFVVIRKKLKKRKKVNRTEILSKLEAEVLKSEAGR